MKIVAIGDIHGRDCWNQIDISIYDKVIFIGDYVDGHIDDNTVVINFKNILSLKHQHPEKIELLLGNHDIQYSEFPKYRCSGFNSNIQPIITDLFKSNKEKFSIAFQEKDWLFTHAGLTNGFFSTIFESPSLDFKRQGKSIASSLNAMHCDPKEQMKLHTVSIHRGGTSRFGGVTWADFRETSEDYLVGYHQVVGHTRVPDIQQYSNLAEDHRKSSITFIDVLGSVTKFHEIETTLAAI